MQTIHKALKSHFDDQSQLARLKIFNVQGIQVEGWMKGEMLYVFAQLKDRGIIEKYDREVCIKQKSRKKCDLQITMESKKYWIELKNWVLMQKGLRYTPKWYFSQKDYLYNDFIKLRDIPETDEKWFAVIYSGKPSDNEWAEGMDIFSQRFNLEAIPIAFPRDYPEEYYLALMQFNSLQESSS